MVREFLRLTWHFLMLNLPLTIGALMIVGYYIGIRIGVFHDDEK